MSESDDLFGMEAHVFNPEILREYDIRGQIGKTLSGNDAHALGLTFGTFVKRAGGKTICVGYDGRESSPDLAARFIDGILKTGMDVVNIGLGPTPMVYFTVKDRLLDAGVMITGSHNPADYNGFKMTLQSGPVYGKDIQVLGKMAAKADFEGGNGTLKEIDVQDSYVDRLVRDFVGDKKTALNVVWDCGNGASGEIVRRLTKRLPGKHVLLYDEIDGTFPNHHPDPTVDANLAELQRVVSDGGFDLGVAFDGDGDRIGAVNEKAEILRCDNLLSVYARTVLKNHPDAPIIGDVKCSKVLFDEIARLGGVPVMWKTGHSHMKAKMVELKAPLGGELSGHIFFADKYYGFDDALYCAVRLMNEIIDGGQSLSEMTAHLPKMVVTPEMRIEVDEAEKFIMIDKIVSHVKKNFGKTADVNDIDGVRVTTDQGWWLIRASNTQAVVVARAEAEDQDALNEMTKMLDDTLKACGYNLNLTQAA